MDLCVSTYDFGGFCLRTRYFMCCVCVCVLYAVIYSDYCIDVWLTLRHDSHDVSTERCA